MTYREGRAPLLVRQRLADLGGAAMKRALAGRGAALVLAPPRPRRPTSTTPARRSAGPCPVVPSFSLVRPRQRRASRARVGFPYSCHGDRNFNLVARTQRARQRGGVHGDGLDAAARRAADARSP